MEAYDFSCKQPSNRFGIKWMFQPQEMGILDSLSVTMKMQSIPCE